MTTSKNKKKLMQGNLACCEGAIAAGCRFFSGYPITPASEIPEAMSKRLPEVGGVYLQMEDELACLSSVIGSSWTGMKAMTATSGPGFSLMSEGISYAAGTETPCVIIYVQRGGPGTGLALSVVQTEVMHARFNAHGDNEVIVLAPSSPQEAYDLTIQAFNLAESYRVPVIVLMDELVAHMREEVITTESPNIVNRKTSLGKEEILPFLDENVAPMPPFGSGHRIHITGCAHDEAGIRKTSYPYQLDYYVKKINNKVLKHKKQITRVDSYGIDDAEAILIAYGSFYRSAMAAVKIAREYGRKIGIVRPITLWPFPEEEIAKLSDYQVPLFVLEGNRGQLATYVKAAVKEPEKVCFIGPEIIGGYPKPKYILNKIKEVIENE